MIGARPAQSQPFSRLWTTVLFPCQESSFGSQQPGRSQARLPPEAARRADHVHHVPIRRQNLLMLSDVCTPAHSAEPALWLQERILSFATNVVSVAPSGFERYARLFHPAFREPGDQAVSWSQVAMANGRVPHAQMQWANITGDAGFIQGRTQPGIWDCPPETGTLSADLAQSLLDVLTRHTSTPDRCWFAVWEGFGGLPDRLLRAPAFDLPHRRYHLLRGALGAILESAEREPSRQSANIWWPDDRSWCVATEIDLMTTYLATSARCLADLQAVASLEIFEASPTDAITWTSDSLNPLEE